MATLSVRGGRMQAQHQFADSHATGLTQCRPLRAAVTEQAREFRNYALVVSNNSRNNLLE
jgi:hypothetical protein